MRTLTTYQESIFEKASRLIGLFLLTPFLLVLTLPEAINIAQHSDYGFKVHRMVVVSLVDNGPGQQAGLKTGDQIIAVGGITTEHMHEYYAAKANHTGLSPVAITVSGVGNIVRQLEITPIPPAQSQMIHGFSVWVAGLSFLLIGWWVLWQQPDPVARNFFAVCLIFAFFLLDIPDHSSPTYMLVKETLRNLLQLLLPAFFLRFFLLFPSPKRQRSGSPMRYRYLLIPGWLIFVVTYALFTADLDLPGSLGEAIPEIISSIYFLGYILAGLIIFGRRVLRRDRPIQQTKLKVVLVGLVGGLAPFMVAMSLGSFLPDTALPHWQYLALSLILVPVSFGLAIIKYGALDTGFVVRISLVYGLLTVMVVLGYFLVVGLVGNYLMGLFGAETWPVMVAIAAASGLVIMPLRNIVQVWIDNTFYPARRANRKAIDDLGAELSSLIAPAEVVSTIQDNLCALYRPLSFALFLPCTSPQTGFRARISADRPCSAPDSKGPSEAYLPADSSLAHLLNRLRRPVFREEVEDQMFAGDTDPDSLRLLTQLNVALIVPLITGDRLLGFMFFGPKNSGALYSQDDVANLRNLAIQSASLVESRQLYQASLDRKRLETELEVARDIQANLLPDAPLSTEQFAISGRNEPCRKVGGDYFDYFHLDNGDLCFAIADVSGKGIPASLMMTSVRVAFRQEAKPGVSPHQIIAKLNDVVMALGSQGHFICFFCGIWTPTTGLLRFCNAGMEPPVLFRPRNRYRQALKKGGPVLGVEDTSHYREGALGLATGDRIFLYTDGLTEECNAQGEFYDTPRLLNLVENHIEDTPETLLGKVFAQVDAFGGANRSDDRTAILMEIKSLQN